jgi:methionine-rich copper-binding protein CopC
VITTLKAGLAFALVAVCACNTASTDNGAAAGEASPGTNASTNETPAPAGAKAEGDQPLANTAAAAPEASGSILEWSRPASGSTVSAPVNELQLHFSPPARLHEVTVTGPELTMPIMVTAVGEVEHYSLPLSGVEAGSYSVSWRATAAGREHSGSFGFSVR